MDPEDWVTHVSLQQGRRIRRRPDLAEIDRIARHYTGQPYGVRDRKRVSAWIEIERWHAWGRLMNA